MKYTLILFGLLIVHSSLAQISEDFSDGDFANNPTWDGDNSEFTIISNELNSMGPDGSEILHLSTFNERIDNANWEFLVDLHFAPSGNNQVRIYLMSDQSDLEKALNGYYIQIGESLEDEIRFFKQTGNTHEELFVGSSSLSGNIEVRIQVTRSELGEWQINADVSGGSTFASEGSSFIDNSITTSSYFGFWCKHTSGNRNNFYFDDIEIDGDPPPFIAASIQKESSNSIRVTFNQNVDQATAETISNYSLNYGFGNPISAEKDLTHSDEVVLTFSEDFVNNSYTLNIDQVENETKDDIIFNLNQTLNIELQTPFRNIVIHEIMADPSPVVGLPDAEYLELYNVSNQAINIGDFMIDARVIDDFVLESNAYVTLTTNTNTGLFSGNVIGLNGLSLSNDGEMLELTDNLGNVVDSVSFTSAWYHDEDRDDGGYSLEQINPELACSYENNWAASTDANGGTPGSQNSIHDNTPDTEGPNLIGFTATDANTSQLTFDEPMDEASLNSGIYSFDNGVTEDGITPTSPGFLSTQVDVTPDFTNGVTYTITISGVTDCAGNGIQANSLSFDYDTNPPELERIVLKTTNQIDVIFNENLHEAIAETENNYSSDHSGTNPTSANLNDTKTTTVSLTFADDFALGVENTLTIENLEDLQGNALATALTPTFTLSQDVDSVYVIGVNLLNIYYKKDLDEASAVTPSNYLVDDEVGNPTTAFLDADNARLVHLAFANNFDDNKALSLSISNIKNEATEFLTTPEISFEYDTSPPKLDTLYVASSNTLELIFAEKVKTQSAESKENYEYNDIFPIEATLKADQQTIVLEFAEDFEREVVFELFIDEVKDLYDNEIKTRIKQAFVYDIFAPELDSVIVKSANELILWFNEDVSKSFATNVSNYNIGAIGAPSTAIRNFIDQRYVNLILPDNLPESSDISLTISAMQDDRGNAIAQPINTSFDYDIFYLGALTPLGPQSIQVEFNKIPSASSKTELSNYKLNGSEAKSIAFSSDRLARLSFDPIFKDDSTYVLTVSNITDPGTNDLFINTYPFVFDNRFMNAELVGDRTVSLAFSAVLDVSETFDLSNFTASPSLGSCQAAIVNTTYLHILHLTFEQALDADISYTISWQNLKDTFGYIIPDNSVVVINDQTPPSLTDLLILDQNTVWLQYSEPLNNASAEFLLNYQITPSIGSPIGAKYTTADSSVLLEFSSSFLESINYTLRADNIEDLADNALFDFEVSFTFEVPTPPGFGDLIITEIMADPTPEVGLANREYLEIFNTTDETISLGGISLVDESGSATIISGEIEGGSYMVLTSTSGTNDFSGVSVIGVTSFPSLNNSGETISIYADDQQIFSTSYSTNWYKDSDKADGGWALEMIDTNNPCGESKNWTASTNPAGGTPGLANSVQASNPDNFGPQILSAIATSESEIEIKMDEKLLPESFDNLEVSLSPGHAIASSLLESPLNKQIILHLADKLETGQSYEITLSKISDCLSNTIQEEQNTATFRLPEKANELDVIINEVLFNSRTSGVDFIEIYNNSQKAINLKDWTIGDKVTDQKSITSESFILNPGEYLALTTDPAVLIIEYPKGDATRMLAMTTFPSLTDAEDSVILINNHGLLIDQMEYQDDYHFNLLDDDDGVSLERVSFEAESTNPDSWKSAASTVGFATPGVVNSQYQTAKQSSTTVSIDPRVFVPDNTGMNDYTTITYHLSQSGNFANVHIYSTNGVLVKTLAEGELLSTTGFFTWDGIMNNGNLASVGYYVVIFETYDGQGNKSIQKETVVLGPRF